MKYMLLIHTAEADMANVLPEDMKAVMAAYQAYTEAMRAAGVMVTGDALQPVATATTVRVREGQTQVLDGPYAEAKEQLGGFYIVDVPSLDEALAWAARCPGAAHGALEVRPLVVW